MARALGSAATRLLALLLFLGMVGCDHATKLSAKAALEGKVPLDVVAGVLDLRYAENRDVAFNAFERLHVAGAGPFVLTLSLVVLGALAILAWRRRGAGALEHGGFALVAAGAIGNVVDRVTRGYVVDFIHVAHWPVFNVADAAIVVGALALAAPRIAAARSA